MYELTSNSSSQVSAGYRVSSACAVSIALGCGAASLYFAQSTSGDSVQNANVANDTLGVALVTFFTSYIWMRVL